MDEEGGTTTMMTNNRTKGKGKNKSNKKNHRQIPAFGNWEMAIANDLPITQYFESALQAGLVRYSSSSSSFSADPPPPPSLPSYSRDFLQGQGNGREKRGTQTHVKEGGKKQAGKVFDVTVTELPPLSAAAAKRRQPAVRKVQQQSQYDVGLGAHQHQHRRAPKAVDEDLYKIPPELIKRKKRLGFISRCLVPPCAV